MDLLGWQAFYAAHGGEDFEIVAVAQDSGGVAVAGPPYEAAGATFTTLVDVQHTVTSSFGMVNVPSGVWIDEEGRIVRPPEVAYSRKWTFGDLAAGDDRYAQGLADWIEKGIESSFALSREEVAARMSPLTEDRARADMHFKLAVYLNEHGHRASAEGHWEIAQELAPDNWNYHRQHWSFDPETSAAKWRAKYETLEGPYYPPADLPDVEADD